jgi:hypothetical protein
LQKEVYLNLPQVGFLLNFIQWAKKEEKDSFRDFSVCWAKKVKTRRKRLSWQYFISSEKKIEKISKNSSFERFFYLVSKNWKNEKKNSPFDQFLQKKNKFKSPKKCWFSGSVQSRTQTTWRQIRRQEFQLYIKERLLHCLVLCM